MDAIQAYRQAEVADDNPLHLIVVLYDQLISDLRAVLSAFAKGDVEKRCQELDHAFLIIGQLQGTLNLEGGGEVAQSLDRFYSILRSELLRASARNSPELTERQLHNVLGVREAWLQVEREQTLPKLVAGYTPSPEGNQDMSEKGRSEWKV